MCVETLVYGSGTTFLFFLYVASIDNSLDRERQGGILQSIIPLKFITEGLQKIISACIVLSCVAYKCFLDNKGFQKPDSWIQKWFVRAHSSCIVGSFFNFSSYIHQILFSAKGRVVD